MSVTDEILQAFSVLVLVIWMVALGFMLCHRRDKALHEVFNILTVAAILLNMISNFHLHHLVVVTMMTVYLVGFTSYMFFSKVPRRSYKIKE